MIPTTDADRAEARRLLSLSADEQRIELIALTIAILRAGRESAEELARMDRELLNELSEHPDTDVPEADIPPA